MGAAIGGIAQAAGAVGAAGIQASAARYAADQQEKAAGNQLDFSKQQFATQQQNNAPYLDLGKLGIGSLSSGLGLDNGTAVQPGQLTQTPSYNATDFSYTNSNPDFTAPNTQTAQFDPSKVNLQSDPGYQFRLDQGLQALQRAQASTGISGGAAAKAITNYAQGEASQEYQNAYSRSLSTSRQNLGINAQNYGQAANSYGLTTANRQQMFQNMLAANQANNTLALNRYNVGVQNQGTIFNRLAAVTGLGQTGVGQLGSASSVAQGNVNAAYAGMGNAASAGTIGLGNALSGLSTNLGQLYGSSSSSLNPMTWGKSYGTSMTGYSPTYSVDPETGL